MINKEQIDWLNNNQGLLAVIIFLITLAVAWISGIFRWLFGKNDRKNPDISAGGDIKARGGISVGNKTFNQRGGKNSKNIQGENITINKYDHDK